MHRSRASFKIVKRLFVSIVATVTSVAAESPMLGLEQLVEAAVQQHPALELSRGQLVSGRIHESSLPWWDTPELRVGYGRDTNVSNLTRAESYPDHEYDAAFRVFPKNPWARQAERRTLRAKNHLLELSQLEIEQQVSATVRELYWEAGYVKAELALKQQLRAVYQDQAKRLETLLEGGQITVGQSLPAKMKRLDAEMEVDSLQQIYDDICGELRALCGVDPESIQFARPVEITASSFDLPYQSWQMTALQTRTDVQHYALLVDSAKAELDTVKADQIPWIKHVQASYQVRTDFGDKDSAGVQIAIDLPFLASDGGEKRMATNMLETHRRQSIQARKMAEFEVQALVAEFHALERQWQSQGPQITSMQEALSDAISKMEAQGNQANQNYWDARVTLMDLELKELKMSRSFQQLLLKAEAVLGEGVF